MVPKAAFVCAVLVAFTPTRTSASNTSNKTQCADGQECSQSPVFVQKKQIYEHKALAVSTEEGVEQGKNEQYATKVVDTLKLFQWNPHWECFCQPKCDTTSKPQVRNHTAEEYCPSDVKARLTDTLLDGSVDFANIIMLETDFEAPKDYSAINSTARKDVTTLFYNNKRWTKGDVFTNIPLQQDGDRAALVATFTSKTRGQNLVVAGAHFPHPPLDYALGKLKSNLRIPQGYHFVLLADTNTGDSNQVLLDHLGLQEGARTPTPNSTCCVKFSDNSFKDGPFDRIATTFEGQGELSIGSVVANAGFNQHKPVTAIVNITTA